MQKHTVTQIYKDGACVRANRLVLGVRFSASYEPLQSLNLIQSNYNEQLAHVKNIQLSKAMFNVAPYLIKHVAHFISVCQFGALQISTVKEKKLQKAATHPIM